MSHVHNIPIGIITCPKAPPYIEGLYKNIPTNCVFSLKFILHVLSFPQSDVPCFETNTRTPFQGDTCPQGPQVENQEKLGRSICNRSLHIMPVSTTKQDEASPRRKAVSTLIATLSDNLSVHPLKRSPRSSSATISIRELTPTTFDKTMTI